MAKECTIDRFACQANTLLPKYNSLFLDEYTTGVDAFAQKDWLEHTNFVHPPVSIMPRVLMKANLFRIESVQLFIKVFTFRISIVSSFKSLEGNRLFITYLYL